MHFQLEDALLIRSNRGSQIQKDSLNSTFSTHLPPYVSKENQKMIGAIGSNVIIVESVVVIAANFLLRKFIQDIFGMLNSQQIIIFLGVFNVMMPGNAYYLMEMLISFT